MRVSDVIFPTGGRESERMNFTTATATATATAKNNQRWPGITSAPSARQPSLVLNMSPDICDPVSHSASAPPAPLTSHTTTTRYRRSPIQVSALWRPVRQKVCPPPSSISRSPTHLHFVPLKRSPLETRQQMPSQRETSRFFDSFSPQGHLFY